MLVKTNLLRIIRKSASTFSQNIQVKTFKSIPCLLYNKITKMNNVKCKIIVLIELLSLLIIDTHEKIEQK